jgi:predicted lipoprotein with Yx(FWY)xxD motif
MPGLRTRAPAPRGALDAWKWLRALLASLALIAAPAAAAAAPPAPPPAPTPPTGPLTPGTSCAAPVRGVPSSPAEVAAVTTPLGRVLVVGSGANAGCSLYMLTSDQPQAPTPSYGCTAFCATNIWPALLTAGAPVAGPGVNPHLLGTVTRTDILSGVAVQQVTYAGHPLYQFFMDKAPGEIHGEDLFDGHAVPPGVWYLLTAGRGLPAPGIATLAPEFVTVGSGSSAATEVVLAALLSDGHGDALFPVYTFSADQPPHIACTGTCAVFWPPLLTARPGAQAAVGVSAAALGTIVRPSGSVQVTYDGRPLYLFVRDASTPGTANGNGIMRFGGTFQLVPLS